MKKIISILISLLFVVSTFGFASVMARPNGDYIDCCSPENFDISKTSVKVGETFTVSFNSLCIPEILDEDQEDFVEKINFKIYDKDGTILESFDPRIDSEDWPELPADPDIWYDWTYKAVKTGEVVFGMGCGRDCYEKPGCLEDGCLICVPICNCSKTVKIASKALPMDWILKKFGLGKNKE